MHEIGLVNHLLKIALDATDKEGGTKINGFQLKIGKLSGVEPEALAFAFEVLAKGTIAQHANLEIESIPVRVSCQDCSMNFEPKDFDFSCPFCSSPSTKLIQGREFELISLEIT